MESPNVDNFLLCTRKLNPQATRVKQQALAQKKTSNVHKNERNKSKLMFAWVLQPKATCKFDLPATSTTQQKHP